jgi:hypothetical protein
MGSLSIVVTLAPGIAKSPNFCTVGRTSHFIEDFGLQKSSVEVESHARTFATTSRLQSAVTLPNFRLRQVKGLCQSGPQAHHNLAMQKRRPSRIMKATDFTGSLEELPYRVQLSERSYEEIGYSRKSQFHRGIDQ